MKRNLFASLMMGATLLASQGLADDAKARAIMEKVDARDDGKTIEQDMKMILIDKSGKKRLRDLKSYSKDFGADEYRVLFSNRPRTCATRPF